MRYLILGLSLVTIIACAQTKPVVSASDVYGINNLENLLKNPSFDNNYNFWAAASVTATYTTSGANLGRGRGSVVIDASESFADLGSSLVTIPNHMKGQNGVAYCRFLNPGTTGGSTTDWQLEVNDGSNAISDTSLTNLIPLSTVFQRHSQNFVFPTSGSVSMRIVSQSGTVAAIAIDDCYLGLADNQSQLSQAQFVGNSYFATTSSCSWQRTNTALGAFTSTAACPGPTVENSKVGSWQTTDTNLPKQTISNLPPGLYEVKVTLTTSLSTGAGIGSLTISDGTTTSGRGQGVNNTSDIIGSTIIGYFEYSSSGDRTFEVFGSASANTINIENSSANERLTFGITRYPLTSEMAQNLNTVNQYGSVRIPGATSCSWNNTSTITTLSADSDCGTPTAIGSGTTAGGKIPGGTFTGLLPGTYLVIHSGTFTTSESSSGTAQCSFESYDGTTTSGARNVDQNVSKGNTQIAAVIGVFTYTVTQPTITFQIRSARVGGNGSCNVENQVSGYDFLTTVVPLSQGIQSPLLVGSVTSNSSGAQRIERAKISITGASTGTINTQSGTWLSGISVSTSLATLTIASGIFSSAPTCTCTTQADTISVCDFSSAPTTTSLIVSNIRSSTEAARSGDLNIICLGPK